MRGVLIKLFLVIVPVALLLSIGLAVPSINVEVQGIGSGSCGVKSPVQWATITLEWSTSGGIFQTWTLSGASVVFSDNVSGEVNFTVLIYMNGIDANSGSTSTTVVKGTLLASSGIVAGSSYQLDLNDTPRYIVSPFLGYHAPKIINATGTIIGGQSSCSNVISITVTQLGVGSTSYSLPPISAPVINITVDNSGGNELRDYVVNFTVSPSCVNNLSKVYVTDSSGNQLYFWAFNDSTHNKIWFWVNYTVPGDSVTIVQIHLNGSAQSSYFDPYKVFWHFEDFNPDLQISWGNTYTLNYNVNSFLAAGYAGYAVDTNATLGNIGLNLNWIAPYFVALYYSGYYYGIGVADDSSLYVVQGTSASGISSTGNSLGALPSWGPGIYSAVFYKNNSASNIHMGLYYETSGFLRGTWNSLLTLTDYFVIGQRYVGTSTYDWIGMRPVAYPLPVVTVPLDCEVPAGGGDYTFTLYFRP